MVITIEDWDSYSDESDISDNWDDPENIIDSDIVFIEDEDTTLSQLNSDYNSSQQIERQGEDGNIIYSGPERDPQPGDTFEVSFDNGGQGPDGARDVLRWADNFVIQFDSDAQGLGADGYVLHTDEEGPIVIEDAVNEWHTFVVEWQEDGDVVVDLYRPSDGNYLGETTATGGTSPVDPRWEIGVNVGEGGYDDHSWDAIFLEDADDGPFIEATLATASGSGLSPGVQSFVVEGTFFDPNGLPESNETVYIIDQDTNDIALLEDGTDAVLTTDENGEFQAFLHDDVDEVHVTQSKYEIKSKPFITR